MKIKREENVWLTAHPNTMIEITPYKSKYAIFGNRLNSWLDVKDDKIEKKCKI